MSGAARPRTRVLVVEDSPVIRELLRHIIGADPRLELVMAVESAEEALRVIDRVRPDVVSLDIRLPGMNGFEATRRIMCHRPTPIVIVSASVESEDLKITMNALAAGALAVVEKPVATTRQEYEAAASWLCTQLVIMSQVRVVRQRGLPEIRRRPTKEEVRCRRGPYRLVGIATSTGGPNALMEVLAGLGKDFPCPVLVVQHMPAGFMQGFAAWLGTVSPLPVEIVEKHTAPLSGRVYLAPADRHLQADTGCVWAEAGEPECSQRPSGTVLFRSMAQNVGSQGIGVLLTGMGEDGAEGLLDLRRADGYTIAEDASTAVVYGMPGAAVKLGAACESLPLPAIAPRLWEIVAGQQGKA